MGSWVSELATLRRKLLPKTATRGPRKRTKAARSATSHARGRTSRPKADFGKRAPLVIKEIDEATAADRNLVAARNERAKAYGPTYEAYLSFKRVVRTSLGPASKEYRSIHIRSNGTVEDDPAEPDQPTPPVVPVPPVA